MATVRPVLWTDEGTVAASVASFGAVGMLVDVAASAPPAPASPTNSVPVATAAPPVIKHPRNLLKRTMVLLIPPACGRKCATWPSPRQFSGFIDPGPGRYGPLAGPTTASRWAGMLDTGGLWPGRSP